MSHTYLTLSYNRHIVAPLFKIDARLFNIVAHLFNIVLRLQPSHCRTTLYYDIVAHLFSIVLRPSHCRTPI